MTEPKLKSCSFAGDTYVTISDSSKKKISEIQAGDPVLSWDEVAGQFVEKSVIQAHKTNLCPNHDVTRLLKLFVNGDSCTLCTPEHQFQVNGKGWVTAENLYMGDQLLKFSKTIDALIVTRLDNIYYPDDDVVYNLDVADTHTYIVNDMVVKT